MKFCLRETVRIPAEQLPGLPKDEEGNVVGYEFELDADSLVALADWLDDWEGVLRDETPAELALLDSELDLSLSDWATTFRLMASTHF